MLRFALSAIFVFAFSPLALAAPEPTPAPTPRPAPVTVLRTSGEQIMFRTTDGREAALSMVRRPGATASVPFGLSETTCPMPETATVKCEFTVPVKLQLMRIRWTKNPDATKIGQLINFGGQVSVEDSVITSVRQQLDHAPDATDLTALKLRCDDFTWLTGTHDAPATFEIAEMAGERMLNNPETHAPENEVFVGHYGLQFKKTGDHELELTTSGPWFSLFDQDVRTWLLGSDILQFTKQSGDSPACQIAVKPDFSTFDQQRSAYEKKYPDETPYIDGSDVLYDMMVNNERSLFNAVIHLPDENWK